MLHKTASQHSTNSSRARADAFCYRAAMKQLASVAIFFLWLCIASADPFVVIVRHAEKTADPGKDPDLSAAGRDRAQALAEMLKESSIKAIFTSEFKRTQQTAAPTAKAIGVTPIVVPANDPGALISKLHELNGNALVIGHGNSIPELLKGLGIDEPIQIQESDYTGFFVVTLGAKPKLLRLRYPNSLPPLSGNDIKIDPAPGG
jgi:phosphohistidine phosphatase SixA